MKLSTPVAQINHIAKQLDKKLKILGIRTIQDLLFYLPFRYEDYSHAKLIADLEAGEQATIRAKVELIETKRSWKSRRLVTEAIVSDESGRLKIIWFGQAFVTKILPAGSTAYFSGIVRADKLGVQFVNPSYEKETRAKAAGLDTTTHTARIVPMYHLTTGISHKQLRYLVKEALVVAEQIKEWLPEEILEKVDLVPLSEAVRAIHFPEDDTDLEQGKRRLKFGELFILQLRAEMIRQSLKRSIAPVLKFQENKIKDFVANLPFILTKAQKVAGWEILRDLENSEPMNRLLEGDVGSGKTVVAAMALYNVVLNGYQGVLMAPTEILALQHFESLKNLFSKLDIKIGLITRTVKKLNQESIINNQDKIKKSDSLSNIHNSNIIVGTHALLSEKVEFNKLGLVIVDEQHRFGVEQRRRLTQTDADWTQVTRTNAGFTQTAEGKNSEDESLLFEDLTYKIRGCIFTVKKKIGLGHKEVIYQNALEEEFKKQGIKFEKEKVLDIKYENKKIGVYRPDFVVENKVIVELKALPFVGSREKKQIWTYLKGSNYKLALLVNFSYEDVDIQRIVYDVAREKQISASNPRQSAFRPHFLSMTATPIPRSFALLLYGDLDLSIINELPTGRKTIKTRLVEPQNREKAYQFIREQVKIGRQVFVICPLISQKSKVKSQKFDEIDEVIVDLDEKKTVMSEYEKLSKQIFPDLKVGYLHGKLKAKEKEEVMQKFRNNEINILVSTSVIEVGVDIPNASVMMIEGAERFGLAQLHQFRGRVGRAEHQSYCLLFTDTENEKALKRLEFFENNNDGFRVAEYDLAIRGPGEVYGTTQSGIVDNLRLATLQDTELIKYARQFSRGMDFDKHPVYREKVGEWEQGVHLE